MHVHVHHMYAGNDIDALSCTSTKEDNRIIISVIVVHHELN